MREREREGGALFRRLQLIITITASAAWLVRQRWCLVCAPESGLHPARSLTKLQSLIRAGDGASADLTSAEASATLRHRDTFAHLGYQKKTHAALAVLWQVLRTSRGFGIFLRSQRGGERVFEMSRIGDVWTRPAAVTRPWAGPGGINDQSVTEATGQFTEKDRPVWTRTTAGHGFTNRTVTGNPILTGPHGGESTAPRSGRPSAHRRESAGWMAPKSF